MSERTETEIKSMTKEQNYMCGYRDGKSDVLDKLRAEIKKSSHGKWYVGRLDGKTEEVLLLDEVLQIIDKYRGESEGQAN